ncbi:MAG: hypothetical protein FWH52_01530 [Synergistaceae bacterium]|nr:hypothetical protein [Synergistaceae bacterium]
MKLSEVFSFLLSAEDQAAENVRTAKNEVERLRRKSRESFEAARRTALSDAHKRARALVESSRQRGEKEALEILNSGESGRRKITELFENNVDEIITSLTNEVAEKYAARTRKAVRKEKGSSV